MLLDIHDGTVPVFGVPTSGRRSEPVDVTDQSLGGHVDAEEAARVADSGDEPVRHELTVRRDPGIERAGARGGSIDRRVDKPAVLAHAVDLRAPPGSLRSATIVPSSACDGEEYGDAVVPSRVT